MSDASAAEIKEIEGTIQKALDVKDSTSKEARDLYQKAIELADKYFKIDRPKEELSEPTFDPKERQSGLTIPVDAKGEAKANTTLGPSAFVWDNKPSAVWLAATKLHEYQHASNGVRLRELTEAEREQLKKAGWKPADIDKVKAPQFTIGDVNEEEVICYDAMLKAKDKLGLSSGMIDWIKEKKKEFFKKMPDDKQKKYKAQVPWLGFNIADGAFHEAVGMFAVPAGMDVTLSDGSPMVLGRVTTIADLVAKYFEGNSALFLDWNRKLVLEVDALRIVLLGPHESRQANAARCAARIALVSPHLTTDGALDEIAMNGIPEPWEQSR
jgi:hypothetical protein